MVEVRRDFRRSAGSTLLMQGLMEQIVQDQIQMSVSSLVLGSICYGQTGTFITKLKLFGDAMGGPESP